MLLIAVDQALIDLIGEDDDILLDGNLCETLKRLSGQHAAGGVIRGNKNQNLGLVGDLFPNFLQIHLVAVLFLQSVADRNCAENLRNIHVVHPYRIRNQNLIARVKDSHQGIEDRLGKSDGYHDVFCLAGDIVLIVQLLCDLLSETHITEVGGIEDFSPLQALIGCLLDVLGSIKVRSSDLEVDNRLAGPLHSQCLLIHLPDTGKADGAHLLGNNVLHICLLLLYGISCCPLHAAEQLTSLFAVFTLHPASHPV